MKFEVHVDDQIFNHKPASKTIGAISSRITTNLTTFSDLRLFAEKVAVNGQTFLPSVFNGSRKKENVIATNFLVIDFDNESSKGVALAKEEQATLNDVVEYFNEISLPPFFAYHSFSHSNNCEKFRILWKLDKPIEYLQIYELAINILMEIINLKYKNKVADVGASKNVAGMFFGSNKGIGYFDETNTLNLGLMFETLNNLFNLNTDDKNRHDARNLERLYERLNISNYLKIFNNKKSESLLNENCGANLESNNILLVNQKCAQFGSQYKVILDDIYIKYINIIYKIIFSNKITSKKQSEVSSNDTKTSENSSKNRYINKYNVEEIVKELSSIEKNEILNPDLLKILAKHCCIIDKYINNQPMKHNDRFVLLSFLLNFKSGAKKYTQYLKKSSGKTSDTNMTSFIKNLYKVSFCNNKSDSCNENHNISHLYSDLKKNTIIRDDIDYYPVDDVRELLNKSMKENFKSIHKEQKVFLYIVDTGVGKTETAFKLINELQLDNYIMAFSLHEKKEEFKNKVNQDVFISLELPCCLKEEHKMMITQTCLKRKSYIYYLKSLLSSQHYNEFEKEKIKYYINNFYKIYKYKKIFTTHAKVPYIINSINPDILIFDETPEKLFLNYKLISFNDIKQLSIILYNKYITKKTKNLKKLLDYLDFYINYKDANKIQSVDTTIFDKIEFNRLLDDNELFKLKPTTPVFEIFKAKFFIYDNKQNCFNVNIENDIPITNKIFILSATPDVDAYKKIFGNKLEIIELPKVQNIGKAYQINDNTYSKCNVRKNRERNIDLLNTLYDMEFKNLITFKELIEHVEKFKKEDIKNYGGLDGLNTFNGCNLIVFGTQIPNPIIIKSICYANYGIDPGDLEDPEARQNQYIHYKGVWFPFYTYVNEYARKVHLNFIYNNLEQAVGRARLVNNDSTVLIFSKFMLHKSNVITLEQLKDMKFNKQQDIQPKLKYIRKFYLNDIFRNVDTSINTKPNLTHIRKSRPNCSIIIPNDNYPMVSNEIKTINYPSLSEI